MPLHFHEAHIKPGGAWGGLHKMCLVEVCRWDPLSLYQIKLR